jgi:uracil-DNA glycosylase family 4
MGQFTYFVGAEGPTTATLAVVAEKGAEDEARRGRPLVGVTGSMLRQHIERAGMDAGSGFWQYVKGEKGRVSKEVWLTNSVHHFNDPSANPTRDDIIREQPRLYRELAALPNLRCILSVGAHALASLTNFQFTDILNRRGSRLPSALGVKLVATLHPSFYVNGEWRYQPIVQFDINRAVEESKTKELVYVPRQYLIKPTSLSEAQVWFYQLRERPRSEFISFDIETFQGRNGTWYVSCIAFSDDPQHAFCIPIMDRTRKSYWSLHEEAIIWRLIQDALDLPDRRYVTQNGHAFDCWQLYKHHIGTNWMVKGFDTYSAHMLLAADLPHDLGFLVSIYTSEPYYKDESGKNEYIPSSNERFWTYNCKDAALTLEVAFGLMRDLSEAGMYGHTIPEWEPTHRIVQMR